VISLHVRSVFSELQRLDSISRSPVLALMGEVLAGVSTVQTYKYRVISLHVLSVFSELQRLDSISRSPVLALMGEVLAGVSTVRAYGHQLRFHTLLQRRVDANTAAFLWLNTANRWLGVRLVSIAAASLQHSVIEISSSHNVRSFELAGM
jgi:hypothetical protein